MKKIVSLILSLCFVLSAITACGEKKAFPENISCEEIMKAAQSVGEAPEAEHLYLKSEENLDANSMSLWADGLFEECKELELLSDYAIYMGAGSTTYEVSVLKAKNKNDIETLTDLIERRKETISGGDKGMYDPDFDKVMGDSVVYTDGLFVIFLLTDDNDAAKEKIEDLKN